MTQIHMLSIPDGLPTFQTAVAQLASVSDILYRGLEFAAFKVSSFRDAEFPEKKLDACLSASIFRAHAIELLKREGLDARADGCHWTFNDLPFLGISFYYNGFHVRILKGPNALMPGCGRSKKKKMFYDQKPSNYLVGNQPMRSKANLIVLWDFDQSYTLAQLWLALPARGGQRPQDVSAHWCEPLDHPAEKTGMPPSQRTPSDDGMDKLIRTKPEVEIDGEKGRAGAR